MQIYEIQIENLLYFSISFSHDMQVCMVIFGSNTETYEKQRTHFIDPDFVDGDQQCSVTTKGGAMGAV